jgi:UDP-3-O-[3-hydroxymyristoyl] glucosamine N-acyltransferase
MGDARFYARTGPHTLEVIATVAKGTAPAIEKAFSGVAPLQSAGPDQVSFLDNRRYAVALEKTMAGAVIVHPNMLERVPATTIPITTAAAYEAWARVAALFHPAPPSCPGVHAVIAETASVDPSAEVGPYVVIDVNSSVESSPCVRMEPPQGTVAS